MADETTSIVSATNVASQNGTFVFPSSSSDGTGKLLTESNIRDITGKLIARNYKVNHGDFECTQNENSVGINVSNGTAIINGYRVVIPNNISLSIQTGDFDAPDVGNTDRYNINLKLATQTSTGGYIADVSSTSKYGVVYVEFDKRLDTQPTTILEYLEKTSAETFKHYKPSMQVNSSRNASSVGLFETFDGDTDTGIIPSQSDTALTFTSLNWVIKRYDGLFANRMASSSLDDATSISVLSGNESNSFSLTIGYLDITNSSGTVQVSDVGTYDCTYRLDIDNVYVGNETLQSYLQSSNNFLKPYGNNTVASVRTPVTDVSNTGTLKTIPYVSTIDSLFAKYTDKNGNITYDADYMYALGSYLGETYNEVESEDVKSLDGDNVNNLQSIVECSFSSVPKNTNTDHSIYSSQVVNSAGYNDCRTAYSYNIIQREYNSALTGFDSKKCKLNKYYVGLKNPTDYLSDSEATISPPFGLYSNAGTNGSAVLISDVRNTNGSNDEVVKLLSNAKIIATSGSTENDNGNIVDGNSFEVSQDSASFNIYTDESVNSSVSFQNSNDTATVTFAGIIDSTPVTSSISLDSAKDTNDKTTIKFSDNINVDGYVRASRVYNAVYNDYAEWYNSSNARNITAGDVIYYNPDKDEYDNNSEKPKRVVGICSEDYAMIIGGNDVKNVEDNRNAYIPVSLCGRVPVKVDNADLFEAGDFLYASGSNYATNVGNSVVGKYIKKIDENTALAQVYLG